ncbi:MAG: TetR/AcrR family transcriptional regulator [Actinomycetota bacterium]
MAEARRPGTRRGPDAQARERPVAEPGSRAARAQRSAETSDLILAEALGLVAEQGLDRTSVISLAQRCGLSTGPVYARYDTLDDIASDLWSCTLAPALVILLGLVRESVAGSAPAAKALSAELVRPSPTTAAICELVAVARRYPQLGEVVREDLGTQLRAHCVAQPELPEALALGQVTFLLGSAFLAPIARRCTRAQWQACLSLLRELSGDSAARAASGIEAPARAMGIPSPSTDDPRLDELAAAVMTVIARVGFEQATTSRIARQMQRGFSSSYARFSSKNELLVAVVSTLVDQIVGMSVRVPFGAGGDEFIAASVANIGGLVAEVNRENRHLRVEMMVAARHRPEIAAIIGPGYDVVLSEVDTMLSPGTSATIKARAHSYWALVRSANIGMSLLASASPVLGNIDWSAVSTGLFGVLSGLGGRPGRGATSGQSSPSTTPSVSSTDHISSVVSRPNRRPSR